MEVTDKDFGFDPEEFFIKGDGGLEMFKGLQVFEIADMLADKTVPVPGDAKGIL
jgi:hypothetical protein